MSRLQEEGLILFITSVRVSMEIMLKDTKWDKVLKEIIVSCTGGGMLLLMLDTLFTKKVKNSSHFSGEESIMMLWGASVTWLITFNKLLELCLFFAVRSWKYCALAFLTSVLKSSWSLLECQGVLSV